MSDPIISRVNRGAYDRPFSGVGIEFNPLGIAPDASGISLHEAGFLQANINWNFPAVYSPFWRLYHNDIRGHCVLFGERMVELLPRELMLIPPHSFFHCLGNNPVPCLWLAFSYVRELDDGVGCPVVLPVRELDRCLMRELRQAILADASSCTDGSVYRYSMALLHVELARPELRWRPRMPASIARAIRFIEENLAGKITSESLSRAAGMSPPHLNRIFRRCLGISPMQFVTRARVREGARRLVLTAETIDGIAEATGFPNRAYFTRVFSRVTRESPAVFRRLHGHPG